MGDKTQVKKFDFIRNQKTVYLIIILAVLGLILLLWNSETSSDKKTVDSEERMRQYTAELEGKIGDLCSKVRGVSNVSVTVYFDSGFETIYAYNEENKSTSSGVNSEKKYVTIGSGNEESMVCVVEKMPNICGIAIVCTGGGNSQIAKELISLISSAYGISSNKIYVTEGKK